MTSTGSLAALLQRTTLDDPTEVLHATDATLKSNKRDISVQLVRIVALLKLDRFHDAAHAFSDAGVALQEAAPLEYAYTLYKTSALEEADQVLQNSGNANPSLKYLEAQIAYKREAFDRAAEIYRALSRQQSVDPNDESDLRINQGAVNAQLSWSGRPGINQSNRSDLEQFETAFNLACNHLAKGDLKPAEILLSRARELCSAAEELSEEEKKAEILPIDIQLVCVMCYQGQHEQAAKIASSIRLSEVNDPDTRQIASANQTVVRGAHANPFLAQRVFHLATDATLNNQLFQFQKSILTRNAMAIDVQAYKFSQVERAASESVWAGVYAAAASARNQTGHAAIKELLPLLDRRPNDLGLVMTVVQLYVLSNNYQTATPLLESFLSRLERSTAAIDRDTRFSPGLTGLTTSLYAGQNRVTSAKLELIKAAKHWRRKLKSTTTAPILMRAAGAALLEKWLDGDEHLAGELFQEASRSTAVDEVAASGLLASTGELPASTETRQQALRSPEELIEGIDVEALEQAGVSKLEKPASGSGSVKRPSEADTGPRKTRRIRKSRMPKNYEPTTTPDPERWLPLRDRSNWRPKGKKRGKSAQGMSTQGGLANDDEKVSTPQHTISKPKKKKGKGSK